MRILIFGDSITQGFWDSEGGWVERLRKHFDKIQLQDLKTKDEPTIFNLGISADNSGDLVRRIKSETDVRIRHGNQVVVLVQIGVNDSSQSKGKKDVSVDLETYRNNLLEIVEQLKTLPTKIIFVGLSACDESKTTPVFWDAIDYTNEQIKMYDEAMKQVAAENKIDFIPVFDEFKAKLEAGEDLLADGLHPNDAGHEAMVNIIEPKLGNLI